VDRSLSWLKQRNLSLVGYNMEAYPSCLNPSGVPWLVRQVVFLSSGSHVRSDRPTDRSTGLLVGWTHL
jgi:hypothetical protein